MYRSRVRGRRGLLVPLFVLAVLASGCLPEATAEQRLPTLTPLPPPAPTLPPPPTYAYCADGETPHFVFGLDQLKHRLGDVMGDALECEHVDPASGDTLQRTTRGLAYYRQSTNSPSFTDGTDHWALTPNGIVRWTGESVDPPSDAQG